MIEGDEDEGEYTLTCDNCGEAHEDCPFDSFADANAARKADNWLCGKGKVSGEWFHLCPDCREHRAVREKFFED